MSYVPVTIQNWLASERGAIDKVYGWHAACVCSLQPLPLLFHFFVYSSNYKKINNKNFMRKLREKNCNTILGRNFIYNTLYMYVFGLLAVAVRSTILWVVIIVKTRKAQHGATPCTLYETHRFADARLFQKCYREAELVYI